MSNSSRISTTRLTQDVQLLKSFMIGITGKDKEGGYRPGFVQRALKASREKPRYTFRGAKEFLENLGVSV